MCLCRPQASALEEDEALQRKDAVKKRAIRTVRTYDEFRHRVACAHLKPLRWADRVGRRGEDWAPTAVAVVAITTESTFYSHANPQPQSFQPPRHRQPGPAQARLERGRPASDSDADVDPRIGRPLRRPASTRTSHCQQYGNVSSGI